MRFQIQELIDRLIQKNKDITFDEIKQNLLEYHLTVKEDEKLFLVAYIEYDEDNHPIELSPFEKECRSIVFSKKNFKPLYYLFGQIIYNEDADKFLEDKKWNHVVVQDCQEGTLITVFYYGKKWYVTTRRCLDARESNWVEDMSHYDMFMEAIQGKFSLEDLDENNCYFFVLIHSKNSNIIKHNIIDVIHIETQKKYTHEIVDEVIKSKEPLTRPKIYEFRSLQEVNKSLEKKNILQEEKKIVNDEGYILRYYHDKTMKGDYTLLKKQTRVYQNLRKIKPNNSNPYQVYLILYQQGLIDHYLDYKLTKLECKHVKALVYGALRTMSIELRNLYFTTRNKNDSELYENLGPITHKIIYAIHAIYLARKKQPKDKIKSAEKKEEKKGKPTYASKVKIDGMILPQGFTLLEDIPVAPISDVDVFNVLKLIKPRELIALFNERLVAFYYHVEKYPFMEDDEYINTLLKFMFTQQYNQIKE